MGNSEIAKNILVITFTRAATGELKTKIENILGKDSEQPRVYTLHSFSLRQLMKNVDRITTLPFSFGIADDYEERRYIMEDLKSALKVTRIDQIKTLFNRLSSNWETLNADRTDWETSFDNPEFIGAWKQHREIFGYVLRSELVYQFKKALEEVDNLNIDSPIEYLIVDEYQDLNRCDLKIVHFLKEKGAKVFAAGDDDQSIYGFRYAYPEGIRNFTNDVKNSKQHTITECHRCDDLILKLSMNVIRQDHKRIPKNLVSMSKLKGEVGLLRFTDQFEEANKIAELIISIKNKEKYSYKDFLILLRSDRHKVFSKIIEERMINKNIIVNQEGQQYEYLDNNEVRKLIGIIKFLENNKNDLSVRTILSTTHGVGSKVIDSIINICNAENKRFYQVVDELCNGYHANMPIRKKVQNIMKPINELRTAISAEELGFEKIVDKIIDIVKPKEGAENFSEYIKNLINKEKIDSLSTFVLMISDIIGNAEPQNEETEGVKIMTMHRAKGLTSKAVFVVGVEEEYLPGKGDPDEERRLLYVSLTRAKHYLFLTYCNKRTGQQRHTGFSRNSSVRNLSRFISDLPEPRPVKGDTYDI